VGHPRAGEDAAREIALFANAAIGRREIDARVCAERPKRRGLTRRRRRQGGSRENGEAELCQHGAGLGALKFSRQ